MMYDVHYTKSRPAFLYWLHYRVSLLSNVQLGDQALQVDLSGFKDQRAGLSASVSGRVQHNMDSLPLLPPVLGLDGSLKHQDDLSEGQNQPRCLHLMTRSSGWSVSLPFEN